MRQRTFSGVGFDLHGKQTRRQRFLAEMDTIVPWRKLCRLIEPHYPKGDRGRPPIGIDRMLRIYFLQVWFNLSDPAVEDALYDSAAMRGFVGIDLGREPAPDETTICKFRHLIEAQGLGEKLFAAVNEHLSAKGIKVGTGTIMDATIIAAPSSTKNADGKRDPEMHQTKKGNQWYFGMKAHIGVDSKVKTVHSVTATPANVHDSRTIPDILHGDETRVWGDSAYQGQREAILKAAPQAQDFTHHSGNRASALSKARGGEKSHQIARPRSRRAPIPYSQMRIRIPQSLLSRHRQEPQPSADQLRAHQSVYEAARTDAMRHGLTPALRPDTAMAFKKSPIQTMI